MKKSLFIKLMLIVSIAFSGIASADSNKKVRWRLAETWGPNFPIFGDATKNMAKMVKEKNIYLVHLSSGCVYEGDNNGDGYDTTNNYDDTQPIKNWVCIKIQV